MECSRREHEMALATAQSLTISDINEDKEKAKAAGRIYNPNKAVATFEDNYTHALEYYQGRYPD